MILEGKGGGFIPMPEDVFPTPDAPPGEGLQIQFYGMFRGAQSIANVCGSISRELVRHFDTGLCSYNGLPFFDTALQLYGRLDREAPIGIYYGIPEVRQIPPSFFQHPFKIGGFVCETDRIHRSWVKVCNHLDLVCVPSHFCRRAFVESGVTSRVMVVPHGLNPEFRPYNAIKRADPFVFFNTFDADSFPERKSAEELIRCFCRTFSREDGVQLHLRTQATPQLKKLCERYDGEGLVVLLPYESAPIDEFAKIYSNVHCVVHPSKGEGFGLIPFQAIACERPVIAPPVTGMKDYLGPGNALLLNTSGRTRGLGVGNQVGYYYQIDEDHLCFLLRYAFEDWESEYQKAKRAGPSFRQQHSWENALSGFVKEIIKLLPLERKSRKTAPVDEGSVKGSLQKLTDDELSKNVV